jgi:hypothetical protein
MTSHGIELKESRRTFVLHLYHVPLNTSFYEIFSAVRLKHIQVLLPGRLLRSIPG